MAKHYPIVLDGTLLKELPTGDGLSLLDNEKLTFGADSDLQIYHDGSNSYIKDNGTGDVFLQVGTRLIVEDVTDGSNIIVGDATAETSLFYAGTKKLETTTNGITVTGQVLATGPTGFAGDDNVKIKLGNSGDLEVYHDGSNSYIKDIGTGNLRIYATNLELSNADGSERYIECINNDAVKLYYNGSKKFETGGSGVVVTGRSRSTHYTDNDGSFNLNSGNHIKCTPSGNITLTFTNIVDGVAGTITLYNTGGHTISAASTTKVMGADLLSTISTAGTYVLGFISDGTNVRIYNSGAQQ